MKSHSFDGFLLNQLRKEWKKYHEKIHTSIVVADGIVNYLSVLFDSHR